MTSTLNRIPQQEKYERSWARLVSDIFSPPVIWTVLAFPLALAGDEITQSSAITAATLYGFVVCWLPVMFIGWMVKRGKITDIHMKIRRQRFLPFGVSITCAGGGLGLLWLMKASTVLVLFGTAAFIALVFMAVVTIYWQISIHAMSITSAIVVSILVFGTSALWLAPLIGLVAAARLKLKRHTPAQLIAGGVVGALIPYLVFVG